MIALSQLLLGITGIVLRGTLPSKVMLQYGLHDYLRDACSIVHVNDMFMHLGIAGAMQKRLKVNNVCMQRLWSLVKKNLCQRINGITTIVGRQ